MFPIGENENSTRQLAAIGRYVVNFELVSSTVGWAINSLLEIGGLSDEALRQCVYAELGFRGRLNLLMALMREEKHQDAAAVVELGKLVKRLEAADEARNATVHATWHIGYGEPGSAPSTWSAHRMKITAKTRGRKVDSREFSAEDLEKAAAGIASLGEDLFRFVLNRLVVRVFNLNTGEVELRSGCAP